MTHSVVVETVKTADNVLRQLIRNTTIDAIIVETRKLDYALYEGYIDWRISRHENWQNRIREIANCATVVMETGKTRK